MTEPQQSLPPTNGYKLVIFRLERMEKRIHNMDERARKMQIELAVLTAKCMAFGALAAAVVSVAARFALQGLR